MSGSDIDAIGSSAELFSIELPADGSIIHVQVTEGQRVQLASACFFGADAAESTDRVQVMFRHTDASVSRNDAVLCSLSAEVLEYATLGHEFSVDTMFYLNSTGSIVAPIALTGTVYNEDETIPPPTVSIVESSATPAAVRDQRKRKATQMETESESESEPESESESDLNSDSKLTSSTKRAKVSQTDKAQKVKQAEAKAQQQLRAQKEQAKAKAKAEAEAGAAAKKRQEQLQKQRQAKADAKKSKDAAAAQKKRKSDVVSLRSGLSYKELEAGSGRVVRNGQRVSVRYRGILKNGKEFDSNLPRGKPFQFKLGAGEVIKGWDQGVAGMKIGGKRQLIVPPHLGYGRQRSGPIPANSTLYFEVHVIGAR
jgi:FK506-binding nuclear protein